MSPPRLFTIAAGLAALGLLGPPVAEACGMFWRVRPLAPEQRPSLSREKVLLIHDAQAGRQHFIREVAFAQAAEPFGFVVPTPTRPEVASVATTPFTALRYSFPFVVLPPPEPAPGASPRRGASGVSVLEVKAVGSFTAFVLAATDVDALAGWLADNQLVSDDASNEWLAHYVELGFYYVALRYNPPADLGPNPKPILAETLRISFATPIPYYPYLEPVAPQTATDRRLLELWFVGAERVVPVALRDRGWADTWVRALRPGLAYEDARESLERVLEPELRELLPAGELVLQTFQDQKRTRAGFGDVLFAFEQAHEWSPEQLAELAPLLGILDRTLVPLADEEVK